jgi:3-hydroxymyristoyl/3-hydroxydecanoyl-(acyl carrier protein) dehydratase
MSRILTVQGQPGQFDQKASVISEYDVPHEAWYLNEETKDQLPVSICLEIALQPCGFLSAYLGTPLRFPDEEYFFRNLDGQASLTRRVDVRGKTIQTRATLLETIFSGTTIIQHFSFELFCDGMVFFKGRSSFGYFPSQAMVNQVGLDGGKPCPPWRQNNIPSATVQTIPDIGSGLPAGKLRLIECMVMDQNSGTHQAGYIYANRSNSAADWYYACHFYQDPVMPGSLGIEAIVQAMTVFAMTQEKTHPTAVIATGQEMTWKYRGQVLQKNKQMQLEVHFQKIRVVGGTRILSGDASLWADDMRIYEIHNLTLALPES